MKAGTRLLAAGDPVEAVTVVGSGKVELARPCRRWAQVMAVLRKGGVIGDIPLSSRHAFDAVVSRRAVVCELDRQARLGFLSTAPSASLRWIRSIALRLDDDRRRLLAIMTSDLTAQVAFVLLEHTERDAPSRWLRQVAGLGRRARRHQVVDVHQGARSSSAAPAAAKILSPSLTGTTTSSTACTTSNGRPSVLTATC